MTKVIDGVRIMTYDEWQSQPSVIEIQHQMGFCDSCGGSGKHECDCGDTHECNSCDGTGNGGNLREVYETALRDEIEKLRAWISGDAIRKLSNLVLQANINKNTSQPPMVILNIQ